MFTPASLAPTVLDALSRNLPLPLACVRPRVGFKIFLEQGVDVVVLEVGLGGRLDATNCVRRPVVCGVASLGFDHMDVLGHTLPVRGCVGGVWVNKKGCA